jgi:hypothetical protein
MASRKLEKSEWSKYFDVVSTISVGMRAEIEIASLSLGDQIEAEWLPLLGIVYDPKDDAVEIIMEGVEHLIHKPREIYVDEGPAGLQSLLVVDADGAEHIVQLREPLMLPAPSTAPNEGQAAQSG